MSTYYKILPQNLKCRGFQYHEGLNIDTNKIDAKKYSYGLHFADAKHILSFYGYGTIIAEVELPNDAIVYHFDDQSKADRIILKNLRPLCDVETMKALILEDVDVESYKNYMLCEAARNGDLDTIKYIAEHGANVHAGNDYALYLASQYGHFDIVKYLVEQGADIHACDDDALCMASRYGYFDIVKYLVEHGANIHVNDDYAIWSAKTPEIKKYLKFLQ